MVLDLNKGMSLDLTKMGHSKFVFGLGWEPAISGAAIDIDASAFLLQSVDRVNKLLDINNAIYFNNLKSPCNSVILSGDSRDGMGDGYDEEITVETTKIPSNISQINIYINIFNPSISFSNIKNSFVEIVNLDKKVLAKFKMSEQLTDENSLLVGSIKRNGRNWDFIAKGEAYKIQDLNTVVASYNKDGVE